MVTKKIAFSSAVNAINDSFTLNQADFSAKSIQPVFFNVVGNDIRNYTSSLWSLGNNSKATINTVPFGFADLLQQDTARSAIDSLDFSANGAQIWITSGGKIAYNAATMTADFNATLAGLAAGEFILDTFSYAVRLSNGMLSSATATVKIVGVNDGLVVEAATLTGAVSETLNAAGALRTSGNIAFSDADLNDVHLVSSKGVAVGSVLGGLTAVKNSDTTGLGTGGKLTWTYAVADAAVEYLAKGQTKVESFNITVSDQKGSKITQQIDVTVTGTNDAPVIRSATLAGNVTEGDISSSRSATASTSGAITFTDVDLMDVHLASATGTPGHSVLGTLTTLKNSDTTGTGKNGELTWTYAVAETSVDFLAKGQTKVESFNLTLDDQNGAAITKQVKVTVTGTNDAPVVATTGLTGAVTELLADSGTLTSSGTIAFADVDLTDQHSLSAVTASANALGTLTAVVSNDTTGSGMGGAVTWNYSVDNAAVKFLALGETKVETFSFNLLDGQGGSVPSTVSVTVTGNAAPAVVAVAPVVITDAMTNFDEFGNSGLFAASSLSGGVWRTDNSGGTVEINLSTVYGVAGSSRVIELEKNRGDASNLYTDINTQSGTEYVVSFDYSPRSGFISNSKINVIWGGNVIATLSEATVGLKHFEYKMLASSGGPTRLEFRAIDANSLGGVLDNILVQHTVVQQAASLTKSVEPILFQNISSARSFTDVNVAPQVLAAPESMALVELVGVTNLVANLAMM